MKLRVAFNARLLYTRTIHGWNRYTLNLLSELHALGVELFLYTDRPLHHSHTARLEGRCQVRVAPAMRYPVWQHVWVPRQCAADRVDLLHTPFHYGLPWSSPCPRVLTLHDAIEYLCDESEAAWGRKLRPLRLKIRFYNWIARTRAHHVITVSEHAKGDLISHLGIPAGKITVIYEAADARFQEPVSEVELRRIRQNYGLVRPYIFYVGDWGRRKNLPFLIQAFGAANLQGVELILAGGQQDQKAQLEALARSVGVADRVRLLGWVEDADLPALYAEALCFVYPSEYEGFGLQLCEAMSAGCPTLAARASCLPEVLGSGGDTFTLRGVEELKALLCRVACNAGYRADLALRAKRRAGDFSWRRTAEQTLGVYRRLLEAA